MRSLHVEHTVLRMWLGLLVLSVLSAENDAPAPVKETGFDAFGVPLVSFNSDIGIGVGAAGGAYFYAPGFVPFRHAISAQVFATQRGVQNHFLRYDGPNWWGKVRAEARLEWRRELLTPYFGPGNNASPEFEQNPDLDLKFYNYRKNAPAAWLRARFRPFGPKSPLEPYVAYSFRWTQVEVFEGSLLAQERPPGLLGGPTGQVILGAQWDTRDHEGNPSKGNVFELSTRLAGSATGSRYNYSGFTYVSRHFVSLGTPKLVFGQRFLADVLVGDVPFFEWPFTGGLQPAEGVGGMSSVRGIIRHRFVGNVKVFANSELRYSPWAFSLFKVPTHVGGLVFWDLGRTWHPNIEADAFWNWHPAVGAGLRLTRRQAVVRFDTGYALESRRLAFYITFGHMF